MEQVFRGPLRVLAQSDNFDQSYALGDGLFMNAASDVTHAHQGGEQHGQGAFGDDSPYHVDDGGDQIDAPDVEVSAIIGGIGILLTSGRCKMV